MNFYVMFIQNNCLQYKADVNAAMHDGHTPLHMACKENHVNVCHVLIENGANIQLATKVGCKNFNY